MASIRDAFEEVITDSHSVSKLVFYAIPIFLCIIPSLSVLDEKLRVLLEVPISILTFGVMLICTYNVRGGKNTVLPSFNIFYVFWTGFKGVIALAPLFILTFLLFAFLGNYVQATFQIDDLAMKIINIILGIIWSSILYTGYLLYAHNFKILEAYNFKLIFKYCMDVFIATIFMNIFIAILNIVLIAPVLYLIWLFFGFPNPVSIFYLCMVMVFDTAVMGHYLAQIDYEIIEIAEESDKGMDIL